MRTVIVWLSIALLGFVLYSIVPYIKHLEGFDDILPSTIDTNSENTLSDLQYLLNTTPNFVEIPEASAIRSHLETQPPYSLTNEAKPNNISHSMPGTVRAPIKHSMVLSQGKTFKTNKTKDSKPVKDHTNKMPLSEQKPPVNVSSNKECPKPVCPKPACPNPICPRPVCPTQKCPQCPEPIPAKPCPNMQNYIRKDMIPCWGCKL